MPRPRALLLMLLAWPLIGGLRAAGAPADQPVRWVALGGGSVKFAETVVLASERSGVLDYRAAAGRIAPAGADIVRLRDGVLLAKRAVAAKEAENNIEVRFAHKSAELRRLKHQRAIEANRVQPDAVTDLEIRELLLDAERAELQLEQARHTLSVARLRLAEIDAELRSLRLRAPAAVFVRAIHKQRGEFVQQGEAVAEVVNVARVVVEGYAELGAAGLLRVGGPVEVRLGEDGSGERFAGVVRFVDVKIEPVSQRLRFTAEASNESGRLREGMRAMVYAPADPPRASVAGGRTHR